MFRKSVNWILIVLMVFLSSGCSTITKGSRQLVTINSSPPGAKVKIGGLKGTTPYTADLATDKDYIAEVSLEGYEDQQVQIVKSFRAGTTILGNIFWLLIGVVIDVCSGAAYGLSPSVVDVQLEKKQ